MSIAIETSCRRGGVALGAGEELVESLAFQADRRHAAQLVAHLDDLLGRHGLAARHVEEAYVSIGPGSFTGLRVGITVARTMAQAVPGLACAAVPTVAAVAENARGLEFEHLAVLMDARHGSVYANIFGRRDGEIIQLGESVIVPAEEFAQACPKPVLLIGEGLAYHDIAGDGIAIGDEALWLPRPEGVWAVGRRMASAGRYIEYPQLRPLYLRKPEAVRLWEQRHG